MGTLVLGIEFTECRLSRRRVGASLSYGVIIHSGAAANQPIFRRHPLRQNCLGRFCRPDVGREFWGRYMARGRCRRKPAPQRHGSKRRKDSPARSGMWSSLSAFTRLGYKSEVAWRIYRTDWAPLICTSDRGTTDGLPMLQSDSGRWRLRFPLADQQFGLSQHLLIRLMCVKPHPVPIRYDSR